MAKVTLVHPRTDANMVTGRITTGADVPFGPPGGKPERIYRFRPPDDNPLGDQSCLVTDKDHLAMFLACPEGYIVTFDEKEQKEAKNLELKGRNIAAKRVAAEAALQKKLDAAAVRRQKRAKETKGEKAQMIALKPIGAKEGVEAEEGAEA